MTVPPEPPELPAVGTRVSLRYLRPAGSDPSMADVVGHLVQTDPRVLVQDANGEMHQFRLADVLYVRRLTDRPVKNAQIRAVEHAAALAWPGTEHQWLDGWWLRAGSGSASLRANSAVPLDMFVQASTIPAIIDWYAQRGLAPRLAVPDRLLRLPEGIPAERQTRTLVRDLASDGSDCDRHGSGVTLSSHPDAGWLDCYARDVGVDVLTAVVDGQVVFASIAGVAVGRAAVTESPDGTRWVGLSVLRVVKGRLDGRGAGHARAVCAALQSWGRDQGATRGYVQIRSDWAGKDTAFGLFESIGFTPQHRSRYLDARVLRP